MAENDKKNSLPEGAATDFKDAMSCGDYLGLEQVFICQEPGYLARSA